MQRRSTTRIFGSLLPLLAAIPILALVGWYMSLHWGGEEKSTPAIEEPSEVDTPGSVPQKPDSFRAAPASGDQDAVPQEGSLTPVQLHRLLSLPC
jgi:hypothetical protein